METSHSTPKLTPARVKICGITRLDQALQIADLGIGALGFVLVEHSKRYVPPEKVAEIVGQVPQFCKTVGIVCNQSLKDLQQFHQQCKLDLLQLHGDESPSFCAALDALNIRWIKAFRVNPAFDMACLAEYPSRMFLLDAWSEKVLGGSGITLDWPALRQVCKQYQIIVAGGLNANNVQQAISACAPMAIDLSSAVEKTPGVKDIQKVKQLLASLV